LHNPLNMANIKTISIIGAGNVGTHLGKAFLKAGFNIKEVWSHQQKNAALLADLLQAKTCLEVGKISTDVDLILISVKDDHLEEVIRELPPNVSSIVHTSGSLEMKLLDGKAKNTGVFYPLQSFNKTEEVDFTNLPICIEASNDNFSDQLFELGNRISGHVEYINSTQRAYLHIAAVFANNFGNYIFSVAYELAAKKNISFQLLLPLIRNTALRLGSEDPFIKQTGPAKRNDLKLIQKHMELLKDDPEAKEMYEFISEKIKKKSGH
jgi:predicted short-subunit dehydrogenase-like oxidoreductase (DUF2520 family)